MMLEKFLHTLIPSIYSNVAVSFGWIKFLNYSVFAFAVPSKKGMIDSDITDWKSYDSSITFRVIRLSILLPAHCFWVWLPDLLSICWRSVCFLKFIGREISSPHFAFWFWKLYHWESLKSFPHFFCSTFHYSGYVELEFLFKLKQVPNSDSWYFLDSEQFWVANIPQSSTDSPHSVSSLTLSAPGSHCAGKYLNGDHMLVRHTIQTLLTASSNWEVAAIQWNNETLVSMWGEGPGLLPWHLSMPSRV